MNEYGVSYGLTTRNKPKLIYQLHFFKHQRTNDKGVQFWKCCNSECDARLSLAEDGKPSLLREHKFCMTLMEYELESAKDKLRMLAMNNPEMTPAAIAESVIEGVDRIWRSELPSKHSLEQTVKRWRQKHLKPVLTAKASDGGKQTGAKEKNIREKDEEIKKIRKNVQPIKENQPVDENEVKETVNAAQTSDSKGETTPEASAESKAKYLVAGGSPRLSDGLTKIHHPRTKLIAFHHKRKWDECSDLENEDPEEPKLEPKRICEPKVTLTVSP